MAAPGESLSGTSMIPGMQDIYNQLLSENNQHYGNVMGAYQQGEQNMSSQLPGIYNGYQGLSQDVMNTLGLGGGGWGVASPAAEAIKAQQAQTSGATTQAMTNAGLGNTTAVSNAQNQNSFQTSQAYGSLGAQLASTAAGYESQIGQAGLGARMQGLGMQTGLTQAALGPLGQQMSNTAGSLTGGYSDSRQYPPGYGGGGVGSAYQDLGGLTSWGSGQSGGSSRPVQAPAYQGGGWANTFAASTNPSAQAYVYNQAADAPGPGGGQIHNFMLSGY